MKQENPNAPLMNEDAEKYLSLYDSLNQKRDKLLLEIRITSKEIWEGQAKVNKQTGEVIIKDGEPDFWDDKYMVSFVCAKLGGDEHRISVSSEHYESLEVGNVYYASGVPKFKKFGEEKNSRMLCDFESFVSQRDQLIADMISSTSGKTTK